jgi:hypothetical protein
LQAPLQAVQAALRNKHVALPNVTGTALLTQVAPAQLAVGVMRTAKAVSLLQLALLNQHLTV